MDSARRKLTLVLILAEVFFLYPLYQLAAVGLGIETSLPPWLFPALAVALTLINIRIVGANSRNITIILINLFLLVLSGLLHVLLYSVGLVDSILGILFLSWIIFRCIYFSLRSSIDIYLHFDISVVVIFLILVILGSFKITLPGGIVWLLFSFLLNIATISFSQKSREAQGYLPWLGTAIAAVILIIFYFTARFFLPYLFEPAQVLYNVGRPVVDVLGQLVGMFFTGYITFFARQREHSSQLATDTNNAGSSASATPAPAWIIWIMKVFYWLIIFLVIAIVVLLLFYLLQLLLAKLLQRQGKTSPLVISADEFFSWRGLVRFLYLLWDKFQVYLLPWLPVRIDILQTYKALLKWGFYRRYPRNACETPYEYLSRLNMHFPQHQQELNTITAYYVQFKYGKDFSIAYPAEELKLSLRRLFFPYLSSHSKK